MDEPLFDQDFYDAFADSTGKRLAAVKQAAQACLTGDKPYDAILQAAQLPLHDIAGEARLLDLFDFATNVSRLGGRLGRPGQVDIPTLKPAALSCLLVCLDTLTVFCLAVSARRGPCEAERIAFIQAMVALEKTL